MNLACQLSFYLLAGLYINKDKIIPSLLMPSLALLYRTCYTPSVVKMKNRLAAWMRKEYAGVLLLVTVLLALHFATIMLPAREVFDE